VVNTWGKCRNFVGQSKDCVGEVDASLLADVANKVSRLQQSLMLTSSSCSNNSRKFKVNVAPKTMADVVRTSIMLSMPD